MEWSILILTVMMVWQAYQINCLRRRVRRLENTGDSSPAHQTGPVAVSEIET